MIFLKLKGVTHIHDNSIFVPVFVCPSCSHQVLFTPVFHICKVVSKTKEKMGENYWFISST